METQSRVVPCDQISTEQGDLRLLEPNYVRLIRDLPTGVLQLNIVTLDQELPFQLQQFANDRAPWIRYIPGFGIQYGLDIERAKAEVFFTGNLARTPNIVCRVFLEYAPNRIYRFYTQVWCCAEENNPQHASPEIFVATNEPSEYKLSDLQLLAA